MTTSIDPQELRRVAILTVLADKIGAELAEKKAALGAALGRGSMAAFASPGDPTSPEIGLLMMSKPRQGAPKIVDEQAAMVWLLDTFGDDAALVEVRLSEQGRKSVVEAAKSGADIPGVAIPPLGKPTASFRQDADAKAAVQGMWDRGEIVVADVLAIEEAQA